MDTIKTYKMDKIKKLLSYASLNSLTHDFPNTIFNHNGSTGLARMQSCIGFLMGIYTHSPELAERMATSLFYAFYTGCNPSFQTMPFVYSNGQEGSEQVHTHKLVVHDDGTFLGFSVMNYYLKANQDHHDDNDVMLPGTSSEYSRKYRYIYGGNGGILFHGFAEVYAVTLYKGIGWQMHT
jgi:hypothetical protein